MELSVDAYKEITGYVAIGNTLTLLCVVDKT